MAYHHSHGPLEVRPGAQQRAGHDDCTDDLYGHMTGLAQEGQTTTTAMKSCTTDTHALWSDTHLAVCLHFG